MKTFNEVVSDFQDLSNDSSGSAQSLAKKLANTGIKRLLGLADFSFNKGTGTISSGTNTQYYKINHRADKIDYLKVDYGGITYTPKEVKTEEIWNRINYVPTYSNVPQYWFFKPETKEIGIFPIPSDGSPVITQRFTKRTIDFSVSDYSTGTVLASSGGTFFQTTTGTWNTGMTGRGIKVYGTNTPIDNFWFEISEVSGTATAYIKGLIPNAIASGSYIISEIVPLPEGFEDLPLWFALNRYYQMKEKPVMAREYKDMWDEGTRELMRRDISTTNKVLTKESEIGVIDPNTDPWSISITS